MTKTLSKLLAVVLSVCMLFAVTVMASAEEIATFAVTGSLDSVTGNWENDYVEKVGIRINGSVASLAEDSVITLGVGADNTVIMTYEAASLEVMISNGEYAVIYLPVGNYISHAETYNFSFTEGAFVDADGALSEELTVSLTGNDIIEKLEVEHISVKPIEKLIDWMYTWGAEGFWLDVINFVVSILNWFLTV